jgi:hypothetical protein
MGQEVCVKCKIIVDEEWPIYTLDKTDNSGYNEVELTEADYGEYILTMTRYALLQKKLGQMYDKQRTENKERIRQDLCPKCYSEESIIIPSFP